MTAAHIASNAINLLAANDKTQFKNKLFVFKICFP